MTPTADRSLAEIVREAREARGLTIDELAAVSKIHRTTLSRIENGHDGTPKAKTLKQLARHVKVSQAELLEARLRALAGKERRRRRRIAGGAAIALVAFALGGHEFAYAIGHVTGRDLSGIEQPATRSDCFPTWGVCFER